MAAENIAAVLTSAKGSVYVERQGTRISLTEGDSIRSTDTVITDSGSTAEVRFTDGATASLSPGTTLEIKDFAFGPEVQPSFILNLAQGTMRSVSGEVVRQNPDAFKIVTPQATVGIRGTELFTAVAPDGQEMHALLHIGKGHIVTITSNDGRHVVMDTALQVVNLSDGQHGELVKQTFQLNELQNVIKSIAPSQVQKPIQPGGPDTVDPADPAAQGQDAAPQAAAQSTTSAVVVITYETESATTAQAVAPADVNTLISIIEQLQGSLADAGYSVQVAGEVLTADGQTQVAAADSAIAKVITENVSQVFDNTPGNSTENPVQPPVQPPVDPPVTPPVDPPVEPPVNPPVEPPVNPPVEPPVNPPVEPPVNPPVEPPVNPPVDPPVNPPVDPPEVTPPDPKTYASVASGTTLVAATDMGQIPGTSLDVTVTGDVDGSLSLNTGTLSASSASGETSTGGDTLVVAGAVNGNVYGDAISVDTVDSVEFARDTITVGSVGATGSVHGDAGIVETDGSVTFGNDEITVNGNVSGTIYGDAAVLGGTGSVTYGNDTIIVKGTLDGGVIYGDAAQDDDFIGSSSGGINTIRVGEVTPEGEILGGMTSGEIHGGAGMDSINISGNGVNLQTGQSATIYGGAGEDEIKIASATVHEGTLTIYGDGPTPSDGDAKDDISIGNVTVTGTGSSSDGSGTVGSIVINGGGGGDTIEITRIETISGNAQVKIDGGDGDDSITIGSIVGNRGGAVEISAGSGGDTITIGSFTQGVSTGGPATLEIDLGSFDDGQDTLYLPSTGSLGGNVHISGFDAVNGDIISFADLASVSTGTMTLFGNTFSMVANGGAITITGYWGEGATAQSIYDSLVAAQGQNPSLLG